MSDGSSPSTGKRKGRIAAAAFLVASSALVALGLQSYMQDEAPTRGPDTTAAPAPVKMDVSIFTVNKNAILHRTEKGDTPLVELAQGSCIEGTMGSGGAGFKSGNMVRVMAEPKDRPGVISGYVEEAFLTKTGLRSERDMGCRAVVTTIEAPAAPPRNVNEHSVKTGQFYVSTTAAHVFRSATAQVPLAGLSVYSCAVATGQSSKNRIEFNINIRGNKHVAWGKLEDFKTAPDGRYTTQFCPANFGG